MTDRPAWRTSPGGLVTALEPVLREQHGVWVGWPGSHLESDDTFEADGLTLKPVNLDDLEFEHYYEGMSNGTLWPLYHDLVAKPEFHREWWEAYRRVNQRFAEAAAECVDEHGVVWVQDYQLQLVPAMLRELRPDVRIGFFLHIPFPPSELFRQLPWRDRILEGLLGADLVGFQRPGGASNFARLVRQRLGYKTHRDRIVLKGRAPGSRPQLPDLARRRAARGAVTHARGRGARRRDQIRSRQPPLRLPRASTGSTTPRGSGNVCAPSGS